MPHRPRFAAWIGIDYSGSATPESALPGLRVFESAGTRLPAPVAPPDARRHWSRATIAAWLGARLTGDEPVVVGIDHAFGYPADDLDEHGLGRWDDFLAWFRGRWPTAEPGSTVEALRDRTAAPSATRLRLTERWTAGAKSVHHFDVPGSVAKSTRAGIPWIDRLRRDPRLAGRLHVWPFDGFEVPAGRSVLAEVFPSLVRQRYERDDRTPDEQDAYAVARWLAETDRAGALGRYLDPPLDAAQRATARREGWILGVT